MSSPVAATPRFVVPALAAVYVIWGSTYLAMRVAVEGVPPFFMASTRFILCGLILLAFLRWRGAPWPTRREWLAALPVGVLMFVLGNGTVAVAEKYLSSGVAAVVCGTMPLWVAAMGRFFGEKTSVREWMALVIGFAGVAILSG
ncbi:MAG TPA: EamA family transporter, partial [Archangium sp.]